MSATVGLKSGSKILAMTSLPSSASTILIFGELILFALLGDSAPPCVDCLISQGQEQHQAQEQLYHDVDSLTLNDQPYAGSNQVSMGNSECDYKKNCNCSTHEQGLRCKAGVNIITDGCACCSMCARQQGDLCNRKDRCDEHKGLKCEMILDGGLRGICRATNPRPCQVDGKTYRDGEQFSPNCSLLCTCQDGKYACSSKCPQELRPPSSVHCKDSHLVSIRDRCCKEWVCPHSHSMVGPEDTPNSQFPNETPCKKETTSWSGCSVTCGTGESIRVTSDNEGCQPLQERRVCMVRPCDMAQHGINAGETTKCRSITRDEKPRKLQYSETDTCFSEEEFKMKYCNICSRNKCCGPEKTSTRQVWFTCPEKKRFSKPVMFIKTCKCHKMKDCPFM